MLLAAACGLSRTDEQGPVELVFWHAWTGHEGKFLDSLVDEFNATHPGIHVKSTSFVIGDKLMAAIAGGIPPDVATVWDWMLPTMGEAGCLMPLNDRLSASGISRDDYLPNIWEYGMFSSTKYGVPTTLNVTMLYYNKAVFREAGRDPEKPPQSLGDLTDLSMALSKYDDTGRRLARIGYMPADPYIWFWNFGGGLYDPDCGELVIDSPENLRALEWMTSFYRQFGIDKWRRFTSTFGEYQSPNNPFYQGQIAMLEEGQWQLSFLRQFAPGLEYGITPYPPAMPGQPSISRVSGSFWVLPEGCPHPDEAWTFLNWLISPPQAARFAAALYNIPATRAALDDPAFRPLLATRMSDFVQMLREGRCRCLPALPLGQQFTTEFITVLEDVFASDRTPEEGLKTIQARLEKALEKSLRHMVRDGEQP